MAVLPPSVAVQDLWSTTSFVFPVPEISCLRSRVVFNGERRITYQCSLKIRAVLQSKPQVNLWGDTKVQEYMQQDLLCLTPDMPLREAAQLLLQRGVNGAPVVEPYPNDRTGYGRLVGVLSQHDILWKETSPFPQEELHLYRMPFYWDYLCDGPMKNTLRSQVAKIMSRSVHESMSSEAIAVEESSSLGEAAELMLNCKIHRLPVIGPREDGKPGATVKGLVTSREILQHLLLLL